jgi:hypothetical protein
MSTNVSDVCDASIIRAMMEAAHTSETSVDIQLRKRQYIPEDSELYARHHGNLKSHVHLSSNQSNLNRVVMQMSRTCENFAPENVQDKCVIKALLSMN